MFTARVALFSEGSNDRVACAMCGKSQTKEKSNNGAPVIQGQKFSAK